MTTPSASRRRTVAADAGALMVGSVVNGLAAYVFVALGTRTYGAEIFAPVSVLWTFWAVSVAVFTFPIQHWIIRTVELDGDEGSIRAAVAKLAVINVGVSFGMAMIAGIWRGRLFGSSAWLWPMLVLAVGLGSAVGGYLRGVLAARLRFKATGAAIGAENLIRLLAGVAVVAANQSIGWYGAALAVGPLVTLAWPSVLRLGSAPAHAGHRVGEFMGGLAGGVLTAQVALNAGPAVLAALGGAPAEVTGIFATLALFRAPYLVALGLATRATGPLTALVVSGDEARLRKLRLRLVASGVGGGALAAVAGWGVGPSLIDAVFGEGVAPEAWIVAAISGGSAVALIALIEILVLLARGATASILASWTGGLLVAVAVLVTPGIDALTAVVIAFVAVEIVAFAGMIAADSRRAAQSTRSRTT